jgi:ATP-dependent DNA helicase RecG
MRSPLNTQGTAAHDDLDEARIGTGMTASAAPTSRQMMEMAVAAMHKSVPERRADGGAPLLVGAAIVLADGRIETASRGELRDGDHAEFTLLERKHPGTLLEGSRLFVTLEPCAGEDTRSERKTPCANRIVQARIPEVWIGIEDPDPTVSGQGRKILSDAGIKVGVFDQDLQDRIREPNVDWIEGALRRAAVAAPRPDTTDDSGPVTREAARAAQGATWADLSREALERYREASGIDWATGSQNFKVAMAQQDWLVLDGRSWRPTKFGVIFFGSRPRDFFPQSGVFASIRYKAEGPEDPRSFEGPAILIPDQLDEWLDMVLPRTISRSRVIRIDLAKEQRTWIRETVMNAIAHRDYDIEGGKISLEITPSSIVVTSPGLPPPEIPVRALDALTAPSLSRNPTLHYALSRINAAEERGFGMKTLRSIEGMGFPRPSFDYVPPNLVLSIFLTEEASAEAAVVALGPASIAGLSQEEKRGLARLAKAGPCRRVDYEQSVGLTRRQAARHLTKFLEMGLVTASGETNNRVYQATDKARSRS